MTKVKQLIKKDFVPPEADKIFTSRGEVYWKSMQSPTCCVAHGGR